MMRPMLRAGSRFLGGGNRKWYLAGGAPQPIAAYCPKGAASLAASYVNLVRTDGTYNAAPGGAPTFAAATGWGANDDYLTTGILSAANMSMAIRFSDVSGNNRTLMGSRDAGGGGLYLYASDASNKHYYNYESRAEIAPALAAGVMVIAGPHGYLNGTKETVAPLTNTIANPLEIYLLAINLNGTAALKLVGNVQAVAIWNVVLTAPQVAAISAAMSLL
jgi:hypothetical protein